MQMGETTNNVIGSTLNPYNRNLSAGGACGGKILCLHMDLQLYVLNRGHLQVKVR